MNAIIDQQNEIINLIANENHNAAIRSPIILTKGERLIARIAIEKAKIKHERNKI